MRRILFFSARIVMMRPIWPSSCIDVRPCVGPSVVQRCEPLSPEGQTVVHNVQHKVDTQRGWYQAAAVAAAASLRLSALVSWWPYMVSVCMPSVKRSRIRGFTKSTGKGEQRGRETRIKRTRPCAVAPLRLVERRAKSRLYLKWHADGCLFLERRVISQQRRLRARTFCLCVFVRAGARVRASLCVTISARDRETWPAVPYIPQGSPRGQCAQRERDQSWRDWERPVRIKRVDEKKFKIRTH